MSSTKVTLTATAGNLPEKVYIFDEPARCKIGRAPDCEIQLPMNLAHADVSRHHCLLDINPPNVRVRDLGSRNGTYVNGEKIGQRPPSQQAEETDVRKFPACDLNDGDEIRVGHAIFRVQIADAPDRPVPLYFL